MKDDNNADKCNIINIENDNREFYKGTKPKMTRKQMHVIADKEKSKHESQYVPEGKYNEIINHFEHMFVELKEELFNQMHQWKRKDFEKLELEANSIQENTSISQTILVN